MILQPVVEPMEHYTALIDTLTLCRYLSLRISSNVLLINLCVAGLVMLCLAPVFFINLHHGGPYLGETGAKVDQ